MNPLTAVVDGLADVRANLGRTVLQTLGVVLGVASVIGTMSLTVGMKQRSMEYYAETGGLLKVQVHNRQPDAVRGTAQQRASRGLTLDDVQAIQAGISGFDLVVPEVPRYLRLSTRRLTRFANVSGVGPEYAEFHELHLDRGRFITADDLATRTAVCVLGAERAHDYFGTEDPLGQPIRIGNGVYTVVGVLRHREFYWNRASNYNSLGWMNRLMLVPATSLLAREAGSGTREIGQVGLRLSGVNAHKEAVPSLRRLLLSRHGVEDFQIFDRKERMEQNDQEGKVYDLTFRIAGLISLLVGGIVVANILLASFTERMREVGVRKALGAQGWHIAVQFLMESVVVSGLGAAAGLVVGVGFVHVIAALMDQKPVITAGMVVAAVISAAVVGVVFGLYPAWRAARLDPVVALRVE